MFTAHDIDSLKRGTPLERRAAAEIERLHARAAELETALRACLDRLPSAPDFVYPKTAAAVELARAALA